VIDAFIHSYVTLCVCYIYIFQMDLNDYELDGYKMTVGWGKPVKITATAASPFVLPSRKAGIDGVILCY
jgi:hypothetical protein